LSVPLRITFVLHHAGISGGVRVVAIYADLLRRRGHDVRVISVPYRVKGRRARAKQIVRQALGRLRGAPDRSHLDGTGVPHLVVRSGRVRAEDVGPRDVVIATWWETAEWVHALPAACGAKAYFVQHMETHEGQPRERVEATWRLPMPKIVVSQWLKDLARDRFGDPSAVLIPNAVDGERFSAPRRRRNAVPVAGFMYSPKPFKGSDLAIEAIRLVRERGRRLRVVAFGADPAADLPPETQFHLRPAQSEIPRLYAACDWWLVPSRAEGFGLPLLEAMACRTPVIATPAGAAPELVGDGATGWLVAPESPDAIARAIDCAIDESEEDWSARSERARERATTWTWDRAAEAFEQALDEIIASATRRESA